MTEQQEQELIANVKSLTDHMTMVDKVFKQARLGRNMVLAFQCGHSGLLYPGNYVKDWGKEFGIGLGPSPVSECLDSEYDVPPPAITNSMRSFDQVMHPLRVTMAQMDYDLVDEEFFLTNQAITANADPYIEARAKVVRERQLKNPRSQLRLMEVAWQQAGRRPV